VLPRLPLTCSHAEMALRAFLDQPLILYGHHDDLAGGLEPLATAAGRVARIGAVSWTSLGAIAEGAVAVHSVGATTEVVPYAKRVTATLPHSARELVVRPPAVADGLAGWRLGDEPAIRRFGAPLPAGDRRAVTVRLTVTDEADPAGVAMPAWRPWPVLRRAGTEARDRLLPLRSARSI
jgi:hypothetical protein